MKNRILITFLLLTTLNSIFTFSLHDSSISEQLLDVFGNDITIDQLDKVLEFNNGNSEALYLKAKKMDREGISLRIPLYILEKSQLSTVESKYHYISILYRLSKYNDVISAFSENEMLNITDSDIIYFLADSYYRQLQNEKSLKMLRSGIHQFPEDIRFYELKYLINMDTESLKFIRLNKHRLNTLFRVYKRNNNHRVKSLLKKIIRIELKSISSQSLNNLKFNSDIISDFKININTDELNGIFYLDNNCNTFADGFFELQEGIPLRFELDRDNDNINDLTYIYDSNSIYKVIDNNNSIEYHNYPYIKKIELGDTDKEIYTFHMNKVKYPIYDVVNSYLPINFFELINNMNVRKIEKVINNKVVKIHVFRNDNTEVIYLNPNNNGWDHCLLVRDSVILSGVRDFNSDGFFDIVEVYNNGVLTDSLYIEEYSVINQKITDDWWKQ